MGEVRTLARRERERFAELLVDLSDEQWDAPSLCAGWSVRDVAAHTVAYLGQSRPALAANMIRARVNVDVLNARLIPRFAAMLPSELVDRDAPRRGTLGRGGPVRRPGGAHRMCGPPTGHPSPAGAGPRGIRSMRCGCR